MSHRSATDGANFNLAACSPGCNAIACNCGLTARMRLESETLVVGDLEVRIGEGLAIASGEPIGLTVREFGLLTVLARRAGHVVSREELYSTVWGSELRPGDRSIDVYVHKLRAKLEPFVRGSVEIATHVGFGYRLADARSHNFHSIQQADVHDAARAAHGSIQQPRSLTPS